MRATCVDCCSHGFIPIIVRDAVGDRHPAPHEANLFDMDAKYGDVVSEAEVLAYLSRRKQAHDQGQPARGHRGRHVRHGARHSRHDCGVVANKVGFDFVYATGYWMTASAFGLPDAGIATYSQMLDRVATLTRTSGASVIADADTGYGGLLNVHHTVRGYEQAGVVGIQIEDQEFPKKCGHTPFKRVVPLADMVEKIKVACEARRNSRETLIIARTDARQIEGFEGAVKRGLAFREAGADVVFLEALESEAEMREACKRICGADDGEHGRRRQDADPYGQRARRDRLRARDLSLRHRSRRRQGRRECPDRPEDRGDLQFAESAALLVRRIQFPDRLRGRLGVRAAMGPPERRAGLRRRPASPEIGAAENERARITARRQAIWKARRTAAITTS